MNFTIEELGAIFRVCVYMMRADGEITPAEVVPFRRFLDTFEGMNQEIFDEIMRVGQYEVTDERALGLIASMDDDAKEHVAGILADTMAADGECSEKEAELLDALVEACGLPEPVIEGQGKDKLEPTFMIAGYNGLIRMCMTDTNNWSEVEPALAHAINAERLEVVRYTPALNELSAQLCLNGCHLVFIMDRNAALKEDIGDNMTGTILYGRGYEIMGDIVFALETDSGYEIKGVESFKKLSRILDVVNDKVGDLLRFPD